MLKYILALLIISSLPLFSQSAFKKSLSIGIPGDPVTEGNNPSRGNNCSTANLFNGQTAVSFWGDSRIDLVDSPIYGNSSLDVYFGVDGWNVQNFGVSGRQSRGVNDEISECFKRETDYIPYTVDGTGKWTGGGDPVLPYYKNFITSKNVAFEIGGNDFVQNAIIIHLFPTMMISYLDVANDEMLKRGIDL